MRFWISLTRYFGKAVIAYSTRAFSGIISLKVTRRDTDASLHAADVSFKINCTSFSLITRNILPTKSFSDEMLLIKGPIECSITNYFTRGFLCVDTIVLMHSATKWT